MATQIASATDDTIEVITRDQGQKGNTGTQGLDGAGFDTVRESLLDSPLCRLFLPNKIVDTLAGTLTATRATTATYVDRYGVVKTAAIDEMREEAEGWLIEGDSTNLLTYSEQFDNAAWIKDGATITPDSTTSPSSSTDADSFIEDTSTGNHSIGQSVTINANSEVCFSVFAKANTRTQITLRQRNLANWLTTDTSNFDLSSGVVTSGNGSIKHIGNGWYRCSIVGTFGASTTDGGGSVFLSDGASINYTGDGISGVYVWGAQLEYLSFASSYIPTTTAAATRSADLISVQGENNAPLLTGSYSLCANASFLGYNNVNRVATIGSQNNVANSSFLFRTSIKNWRFSSGGNSAIFDSFVEDKTLSSACVTFDGANYNGFFDGVADSENPVLATSPPPEKPNLITLGSRYSQDDNFLFGHILDFRVYDFALNADEALYLSGVK